MNTNAAIAELSLSLRQAAAEQETRARILGELVALILLQLARLFDSLGAMFAAYQAGSLPVPASRPATPKIRPARLVATRRPNLARHRARRRSARVIAPSRARPAQPRALLAQPLPRGRNPRPRAKIPIPSKSGAATPSHPHIHFVTKS